MIIRVDIWGGKNSCVHLARYHLADQPEAGALVMREARDGFLVNVRVLGPGEGWGPAENFDKRGPLVMGRA
ncbi:MAG: hypothetical protein WB816_15950 [Methylocystis sp.]